MQLVIAEKPSVARDLARVLGVPARGGQGVTHFVGGGYAITWCIGHLVELVEPASYDAAWKAWRLDRLPMLPEAFRLQPAHHARAQLRAVAALLGDRSFSAVINACDAGREGELIFRYVYEFARSRLPIRRLWISSLTDDAIRKGMAALRPGAAFDHLADAARSRSEADWLVGMNATRAVTVRARATGGDTLASIGRVQTPTLAMLVAREREIRDFVPAPYWEVRATLAATTPFTATWKLDGKSRLGAAPLATSIVDRDTQLGEALVERVTSTVQREPPPQLFDLTSLQRTANRRFGFSAQRTLELAQALYERHKLLTYPRTDSRYLSTDVAADLTGPLDALAHAPAYAPFTAQIARPATLSRRFVDDTKVRDHHAIIPTATPAALDNLDRDTQRIYDLVTRRFLGAFFPDAQLAVTEVWLAVGSDADRAANPLRDRPRRPAPDDDRDGFITALPPMPDRYLARGRVRLVAGWQDVAGIDARAATRTDARADGRDARADDRDDNSALPPLAEGQRLSATFAPVEKATKPPPRYTEATLLAAMETAGKRITDEALRDAMKDTGLGTPATRASIIETLLRRDYIARDRKDLVATPLGMDLIASLPVPSLASPELTGQWEARLAAIARGEDSRAAFMADIARYVTDLVSIVRGSLPPGTAPSGRTPESTPSAASSQTPSTASPAPARGAARKGRRTAASTPRDARSDSASSTKRATPRSRKRTRATAPSSASARATPSSPSPPPSTSSRPSPLSSSPSPSPLPSPSKSPLSSSPSPSSRPSPLSSSPLPSSAKLPLSSSPSPSTSSRPSPLSLSPLPSPSPSESPPPQPHPSSQPRLHPSRSPLPHPSPQPQPDPSRSPSPSPQRPPSPRSIARPAGTRATNPDLDVSATEWLVDAVLAMAPKP